MDFKDIPGTKASIAAAAVSILERTAPNCAFVGLGERRRDEKRQHNRAQAQPPWTARSRDMVRQPVGYRDFHG
ncbi:MAG: hypothetical protein QNJ92_13370 [Alphaproteobacteria bacterium]|nr:hypothetical protein [Alphaproteobacteria bacterium]